MKQVSFNVRHDVRFHDMGVYFSAVVEDAKKTSIVIDIGMQRIANTASISINGKLNYISKSSAVSVLKLLAPAYMLPAIIDAGGATNE